MIKGLDHYCKIWGLRPLQKLVEDRPTSEIYKVDFDGRPAVLKLLTPLGAEDERHGAWALRLWAGNGAAHVYQADAGAHLLEFIDGPDCVALVRDGYDAEASEILGDTMARLHAAYPGNPPDVFTTLEQRFSELFSTVKSDGIDPIFGRGAHMARRLLDAPLNEALPHGDLHHENMMHSSTRGWLVIDAKGLRGETTYDGAMAVLNPLGFSDVVETPERIHHIVGILAKSIQVPEERLLQFTFAHACLSASWAMETSNFSSSHALGIARLIEPML